MSLLLIIFLIGTSLFFGLAEIDWSNSTVECIVQTAQLVAKRKIGLEFGEENQNLVHEILQKMTIPVVLNVLEHRKENGIETRVSIDVLLLLKDEQAVKIVNDSLWNGDTRFIIVTRDEETVQEYFQNFWELKVINVFGLVVTEGGVSIYSFLPYGKNNCTMAELIIVDSCSEGKLQNGGAALLDRMRIKNMNQCPVNITITQIRPGLIFEPEEGWKNTSTVSGFEGNLMMEVTKVLNFNATFKIAEDGIGWGWVKPSPRGAIADLYRGICDITIGLFAPFLERYEYFDLGANYYSDECITFGLPQGIGAKRATWLTNFVLEFDPFIWILVFISFLTVAVNVSMINKHLNLKWLRDNVEVAILLFSSCMDLPVKTPNLFSARTSVISWIVCMFIIKVAYTASMGSKLAVPPRDADVDNFQQLLDSDVQLIGLKNQIQMLRHPEWPYPDLRNRYGFTNDTIDIMVDQMANGKKVASLYPKSCFYYYSLQNPKARGRIHVIRDCVYNYHPNAILKKFSPFTRRVNQVIRRLEEAGIMEKWRAQYFDNIPPPKKPFYKLSLEQMFGVFCFLLVGWVISFCSFLWEINFRIIPPFLSSKDTEVLLVRGTLQRNSNKGVSLTWIDT